MPSIYILKSLKNGKRYIGSTRKNPQERLKEHHSGTSKWTRENGPFILIYQEKFDTYTEALKRERFLKSGQGRKFLSGLLQKPHRGS